MIIYDKSNCNGNNISSYHRIFKSLLKQYLNGKFISSQVLATIGDHLNPCTKPANKPAATRTVFTTQIWDVTGITQSLLKTAVKQLRAWDRSDKKSAVVSPRRPKVISAQSMGSPLRKELNTCPRDGREVSSEHGGCWTKKYKAGMPPQTANTRISSEPGMVPSSKKKASKGSSRSPTAQRKQTNATQSYTLVKHTRTTRHNAWSIY